MFCMLSFDLVHEFFVYDPVCGVVTNRLPRGNGRVKVGVESGSVQLHHGGRYKCRVIEFGGVKYKTHQLIWFMQTGAFPVPPLQIDHVNGDGLDNRWCNLRVVTPGVNMQNGVSPYVCNMSGFRGVQKRGTRWRADISIDGTSVYLGSFDTPEEASKAYWAKKYEVHGGEVTFGVRLGLLVGN